MNVLGLALVLACLPSALLDYAMPKWAADKDIRIEDAYKWTYQATRGGEHAAPDAESAKKWLTDEWSVLTEKKAEPIWESLCPDGEIGRINLRPFKLRNGNPDDLIDAFLSSSREFRSEAKNFIDAWYELGRRLKKTPIGSINYAAWLELDARMKAKNYPAIHHSETYEKAHLPAYRVITIGEAKKLLAIVE